MIASVMMAMAIIAIESTIVSTAMPQIVSDLGGLQLYSWVFSSFLLTQAATTVMFGSLADVFGRKPIMFVGIGIFLLGSLLAGFAWSMPTMIACRLIQGVGAGAIQPVAMTIVADLYPARERGKVQGYLASVWAIAAVLGPLLGGVIIHSMSWPVVFWVNIPVGMAAAAGFHLFLREQAQHVRRSVDVAGAVLFTVVVTSLLIALTEFGNHNPAHSVVATAVFFISSGIFWWAERRAAHPLISFSLWAHRPVAATNAVAVLSNMSLIGLTTFLPMYVQLVMRQSPTTAGLALTTMLIGWPVGATLSSRLFHRYSLRNLLVCGAVLLPAGALIFVMLEPGLSPWIPALGSLVMGFGMGLISVPSLVLLQEVVDSSQRGIVTASNIFSRNLGSTLGATLLGAVLNHWMMASHGTPSVTSDQLRQLLSAPAVMADGDSIRISLQQGLHWTFFFMFLLAVITAVAALLVPASPRPHALSKQVAR